MKIMKVEPIVIEIPLEAPIVTHFGSVSTRTCLLVKIVADSGYFGIGEIWNSFPDWGIYEKIATLKQGIEPLLIGEDALDIERINRKLHDTFRVLPYHIGAIGPFHHSVSGINVALWDLLGRYKNKPICQLIQPTCLTSVPVYASGLSANHLNELVGLHQQMGITSFKLRVGNDQTHDMSNLQKLRGLLRDEDQIMVDANQAWDLNTALKRLEEYKSFGIRWVEEPVICHQLESMRVIAETTGIPVAAGENYYTRAEFADAVQKGSVQIIQPDASKTGGLTDMKEIITGLRQSRDVAYAPHCLNSAVCFAASIQLYAAVPGGVILEMDANPNPLREKLFTEPFHVENGQVSVSLKPGLGYELDEQFIEFYRRKTALQLSL